MANTGQFKGSRGYYKSKDKVSKKDLEEALKRTDSELVNADGCDVLDPQSLLTEEEMDRLMDRSPEAYHAQGVIKSEKYNIFEPAANLMTLQ